MLLNENSKNKKILKMFKVCNQLKNKVIWGYKLSLM